MIDNSFFLYIIGLFALIWFLMIAPQRKREKERVKMLDNLEVDDRIVTIGGIYGYIDEIRQETVVLEIANGVAIIVAKNAIAMVKNEDNEEDDEENVRGTEVEAGERK